MRKAGVVMQNMRKAGYTPKMANTLCRALFCEQDEKQLRKAFKFYDTDESGAISQSEFRQAIPLMGENITDDRVDELFKKAVDEDGTISFDGFCRLVRTLNPKMKRRKKGDEDESEFLGAINSAVTAVSKTWKQRTKESRAEEKKTEKKEKRQDSETGSTAKASAGSSGNHASAGRAIVTLPPKSERVQVL